MKRCARCQRLNRDEDLACVICHTSLAEAETVPDTDASEDWWRVCHSRRERIRREAILPAVCHAAIVGGMAMVMTFYSFLPAIPYFVAGAIVGVAVCLGWEGRFRVAFLQLVLSTAAVAWLGPFNFLTPFVVLGHIIFAMFLGLWTEFGGTG